MARPTLEEIKATADEYAKLVARIERKEKKFNEVAGPAMERHEKTLAALRKTHAPQIDLDIAKAAKLKAEVIAWLADKKKSYKAEGEIAEFGVTVGEKQLERQPDKKKLWDVCKKKGVEFFDLVTVMLAEADKRLGTKEVNAISVRRIVPTRDEYLKLKS